MPGLKTSHIVWTVPGSLGATCYVVASDAKTETKTWAAILQNAGYPVWVCSGTADEVPWQAAIDALPSLGGSAIGSEGNFNLAASIEVPIWSDSRITIKGQGRSTCFKTAGLADHFIKSATATDRTMHTILRDFWILGTNQTAGCGIYLWGPSYVQLHNIHAEYCFSHGISLASNVTYVSVDAMLAHCITNNNGGDGLNTTGYVSDSTIISHNSFNNTGSGIAVSGGGDHLIVPRCYGNGVHGLYMNGYGNNVIAPECASNTEQGIISNLPECNIIGGQSTGNTLCGVYLTATADRSSVAHMNLYDNWLPITDLSQGSETWDLKYAEPIYEKRHAYVKNTSGGSLVAGDVVIMGATGETYTGTQCITTTAQGDDSILGMVVETIADDASGYVQVLGKTTVLKVDGTDDIAIDDFLCSFTTAKIAAKAGSGDMAFAKALEAYATDDSSGVIDALLIQPRKI